MTFMAKGLMMILLLLAGSACGLAQSYIPLEVQPFDYTLDVHGTRYAGTAVVSPVPGEPLHYPLLRFPSPETGMGSPRKVGSGCSRQ